MITCTVHRTIQNLQREGAYVNRIEIHKGAIIMNSIEAMDLLNNINSQCHLYITVQIEDRVVSLPGDMVPLFALESIENPLTFHGGMGGC